MRFGEMFLALFFTLAPSSVPDWRADPGMRISAVLAVGEPALPLVPTSRSLPDLESPVHLSD
jgi:hypothetical protein